MSEHLPDASNATIIGSGTTGATVAGATAMGWINEYAVVIGLVLSLVSLIVGICFNISASHKRELLQREALLRREEEARLTRLQIDALTEMIRSQSTRHY